MNFETTELNDVTLYFCERVERNFMTKKNPICKAAF